jgi:hypothetical protein
MRQVGHLLMLFTGWYCRAAYQLDQQIVIDLFQHQQFMDTKHITVGDLHNLQHLLTLTYEGEIFIDFKI